MSSLLTNTAIYREHTQHWALLLERRPDVQLLVVMVFFLKCLNLVIVG